MRAVTYGRVSTDDQELKTQENALGGAATRQNWEVVGQYSDKGISGKHGREKRPGFDALCKAIERKEVDVVMVWSVDRIARSLQHFVEFMLLCERKGVRTYFHQNPSVSTSDPMGMAMLQVMGVFAELERNMMSVRMKESYVFRRTQAGRRFGRKPVITTASRQKVLILASQGKSCRTIAQELKLSKSAVGRIIAAV